MRERDRRDAGDRLLGSTGRNPGDRAARRRKRLGRAAPCGLDCDEYPPRGLRRLADWSVARCAGKVHVPSAGPRATARRSRERRGTRRRGHLGRDRRYRIAAGRAPGRGDALWQEHRLDALPPRHPVRYPAGIRSRPACSRTRPRRASRPTTRPGTHFTDGSGALIHPSGPPSGPITPPGQPPTGAPWSDAETNLIPLGAATQSTISLALADPAVRAILAAASLPG